MMNRILVWYEPIWSFYAPFYAVIQTETGFLFHYCTKGLFGEWDKREFQRSVKAPGPKDFVIERAEILKKQLNIPSPRAKIQKTGRSRNGPGYCGWLELQTEKKTYHFAVLGDNHRAPELCRFFDISDSELIVEDEEYFNREPLYVNDL